MILKPNIIWRLVRRSFKFLTKIKREDRIKIIFLLLTQLEDTENKFSFGNLLNIKRNEQEKPWS
jgi:hypothetical protein